MKKIFTAAAFLMFLISLSVNNAQSENQGLVTDRPDQTESPLVVPLDAVQIELGFVYQKQKYSQGMNSLENDNLSLGSTLIRYGVSPNFELRFGGEYFTGQTLTNGLKTNIQGMQNLLFGGKLNLRKGEKIFSDIGIILQTILPFGSEKLRTNNFVPKLLLSANQNISESTSFGFNLGIEKDLDSGINSYIYSGTLAYSISESLGTFFEFYGSALNESIPSNNFDLGITYLFKQNIQVDFSLGTSIITGDTDYFGGFGISIRLPK
ncbi:MAG: hypothetical protein CVV24_08265 [Ignavibacteriae bacterium HGW-Ignavibacteriae-3]|nr:MAG: hypothetical protein CVV24_08265 [Ignavibacteriae bacterium HGW-Ignavibacteriae-3]